MLRPVAIALALALCVAPALAGTMLLLGAGTGAPVSGGGGGGGTLAVEGQDSVNGSDTINITTAGTNREVCVGAAHNGSDITSITGGSITFAQVGTANAAGDQVSIWCGLSAAQQTAATLTVTWVGSPTFRSLAVMAVSGVNTGAPFDTNMSLPVQTTMSGDQAFSTTAADTVAIAAYACNTASQPTAGAGWTGVAPLAGSFFLLEYEAFSSAQTSTTAATGTCTPIRAVITAVKA